MSTLHSRHFWPITLGGVLLILIIAFSIGELLGWPFLAAPIANRLSEKMERKITFSSNVTPIAAPSTATKQATQEPDLKNQVSKEMVAPDNKRITPFKIRLLGGFHIQATQVTIAAPSWSKAPHTLLGHHVVAEFNYMDLWRAYRGQGLNIERLQADTLDLHLERLANGNASWKKSSANPLSKPMALPTFGSLQVKKGALHYQDAILNADVLAQFSFSTPADIAALNKQVAGDKAATTATTDTSQKGDKQAPNKQAEAAPSKQNSPQQTVPAPSELTVTATGTYKKLPLTLELFSSGTLSTQLNKADKVPVDLTMNGRLGRATITFKGRAKDALKPTNFAGNFTLKGPSLAALGDLVKVTLPTTAEFYSKGYVDKEQSLWKIDLKQLDIGASHLNGQFLYDKGRKIPLLSGQLKGNKFLITDLGPAFGSLDANKPQQKVLPRRPFDLKSLRTMQADVKINIQYVDLNTKVLQPLSPLRGHLTLNGGVLKIQNLDARTAKGQLMGNLKLDGRGNKALWNADLRWSGVRLENWVRQVREKGEAPYISGNLHGKAALNGVGISSAEMLATLKGSVQSELQNGALSHLVVEAAGLDLAQSLGVMFKGDDALPLHCAVADLVAENGVLKPKVMVLDTEDSALWLTGAISLAQESIDLKLVVMPKDFSPLSLRSPLHVSGTFANPKTSLEKRKIGMKLAGSALLSLLNPLAAIIPLLDNGDVKEAKRHAADCSALMQHGLAKTKAK